MAPEDYFGPPVAERYDEFEAEMFDPAVVGPAVDLLAELARTRPALEFGIGTGRIALPLGQRGIPVRGIELSEAMAAEFRAKPGAGDIEVTIGDFSTTAVEGQFAVVYLVFNTIMNLTTMDQQLACFRNAASHLTPGGCFVVEVGIPELRRLPPGETIRAFSVKPDRFGFDEYDVASQRMVSHHYSIVEDKLHAFSVPFRYVWPAELDLMALLAGMTLHDRWEDWDRSPFTSESVKHVSVWERAETPR